MNYFRKEKKRIGLWFIRNALANEFVRKFRLNVIIIIGYFIKKKVSNMKKLMTPE